MTKKRKNDSPASPPHYRRGDQVSFLYGFGNVVGIVTEDRGAIGVGGRRLYRIEFVRNPDDLAVIEMPEEEISLVPS